MAQINLLKQNNTRSPISVSIYRFLPAVFGVVLLGVLIYYGWLFADSSKLNQQSAALQTKISAESSAAYNNPRRNELLTRQLQLKDLSSLVAAHVYWTQIFPDLAQATLKNATYNNLKIDPQTDTITLSATVPTLTDLDKYMQVFNLPEFYKYFSNVKVSGFSNSQGKTGSSVSFQVEMNYDRSLVQYNASSN